MRYAFGDSDLAALRLERLAQVFDESTRVFVCQAAAGHWPIALDLGCGPGFTTHRLAELLSCDRVVGLDNSPRFIDIAQQSAAERVSFICHDFTETPFPIGPVDLLYARYVLTHVTDAAAIMERWATQLQPGGLMLLEETEWIETTNPAFAFYLSAVERMLASQGNILYIGPLLEAIGPIRPLRRRSSQVRRLTVTNRKTADMFSLNIRSWRHHPFIQATYPAAQIDELQQELDAMANSAGELQEIEWGLRQMTFERL